MVEKLRDEDLEELEKSSTYPQPVPLLLEDLEKYEDIKTDPSVPLEEELLP